MGHAVDEISDAGVYQRSSSNPHDLNRVVKGGNVGMQGFYAVLVGSAHNKPCRKPQASLKRLSR